MMEHNLQPEQSMIKKVIQLYETMIVRWGVMLVGPTGGGKTAILNVSIVFWVFFKIDNRLIL